MDRPKIDYNAIVGGKTLDARLEALENEIAKAGYVCLTDAITHYNFGGAMVFERIAKETAEKIKTGEHRKFKLFVIRNEWGEQPKPGDVVTREIMKPLKDRAGRKLRTNAINDMRRRGTWKKNYIEERRFVVDDRGCIECSYDDAAWFLQEYGVNFEDTSVALCGRRETSSAPCKMPGGGLKHVWYWRYWEAPPWVYEGLPNLTKPKPKRKRRKAGADPAVAAAKTEDNK